MQSNITEKFKRKLGVNTGGLLFKSGLLLGVVYSSPYDDGEEFDDRIKFDD